MDLTTVKQGLFPRKILAYLELSFSLGAGVAWYLDKQAGFWPMIPLLLVWVLGIVGDRLGWWRYTFGTPLDLPILVFLSTACIALWVTYDPESLLTTLLLSVWINSG